MYYSLATNQTQTKYLLYKSTNNTIHPTTKKNTLSDITQSIRTDLYNLEHTQHPPTPSKLNTDSYKRSLRRSFNHAKKLAFFNPDLNQFITLTYKENHQNPEQTIEHIKQLIKQNKKHSTTKNEAKYIYVMELQKRGAIHVHMIANQAFVTEINKNGYRSIKYWPHGYSSILDIKDFDSNFKPYLYLFKYMHKAERVGKSFIHVSRNFGKIEKVDYNDHENKLEGMRVLHTEISEFTIHKQNHTLEKLYLLQE